MSLVLEVRRGMMYPNRVLTLEIQVKRSGRIVPLSAIESQIRGLHNFISSVSLRSGTLRVGLSWWFMSEGESNSAQHRRNFYEQLVTRILATIGNSLGEDYRVEYSGSYPQFPST